MNVIHAFTLFIVRFNSINNWNILFFCVLERPISPIVRKGIKESEENLEENKGIFQCN